MGILLVVFMFAGSALAATTDWRGRNTAAQGSTLNANWFDNKAWVDSSPEQSDIANFSVEYLSSNAAPVIAGAEEVCGELRVISPEKDVVLTIESKLTLHASSDVDISMRMSKSTKNLTITGSGIFKQDITDSAGGSTARRRWYNNHAAGSGNVTIETAGFEIADGVALEVEQFTGTTAHFKTGVSNTTAAVKKEGNGLLILSGQNQWTGRTWIHGGTLRLATDNAVSSSSQLFMNRGAILETGGFDCDFATLDLQNNGGSIIDFENIGSSQLTFADSSDTNVVVWAAVSTLNITNFTVGSDSIRFSTNNAGLTLEQLSKITINGEGNVIADADGYLIALPPPELGDLSIGSVASNNTVEISWASTNAQPYEVQYREDLISGIWQHHSYVVGVSSTNVSTIEIPADQTKEFYRVIVN